MNKLSKALASEPEPPCNTRTNGRQCLYYQQCKQELLACNEFALYVSEKKYRQNIGAYNSRFNNPSKIPTRETFTRLYSPRNRGTAH